jgi:alpha-L-fucosidase
MCVLLRLLVVGLMFFCVVASSFPASASPAPDPKFKKAPNDAVEAWKDMKYGLRIHWGLYCMDPDKADGESWKLGQYAKDPAGYKHYQDRYKCFDPTGYDPNAWMDMMVNGGMTFFSFTTKHHEGFSMYDTKYTVQHYVTTDMPGAPVIKDCPPKFHYSIMDTPYHKDVLAMLVKSALGRKLPFAQGVPEFGIGLYYTDIDWYDADFRFGNNHPLYPGGSDKTYTAESDPAGYQRAHDRLVGEIDEICKAVPKNRLLSICFDMSFPNTPACSAMVHDMAMKARADQPNCLFRDRCVGQAYADYYTPERSIKDNQGNWMSIYPLGRNFDYDPVGSDYKGAPWIIHNLVDVVARGGLFQIGLGPDADGKFHPVAVGQVLDAGKWLKANHECIYSTRTCDVTHEALNGNDDIWYTRTKDGKYAYVICRAWPGDTLTLEHVRPDAASTITMLADPSHRPITWTDDVNGLHLNGLAPLKPDDVGCGVWVFKVQGKVSHS